MDFNIKEARERAEGLSLTTRIIPLNDLRVVDAEHIDWNVEGSTYKMGLTGKAFGELMKAVGVTSDGGRNVAQVSTELLNLVKDAVSAGGKKVAIMFDRERTVRRVFTERGMPKVTVPVYFDVLERLMNVDAFWVHSHTTDEFGRPTTTLIPEDSGMEFALPGLPDEVFKPGITVALTDRGLTVSPYTFRMLCSNGMTLIGGGGDPGGVGGGLGTGGTTIHLDRKGFRPTKIVLAGPDGLKGFVEGMAKFKEVGYADPIFAQRAKVAAGTQASYAELLAVDDLIRRSVGRSQAEDKAGLVRSYVDLSESREAYRKAGIQVEGMAEGQLKMLRSHAKVWDLVNAVTDLASNDRGLDVRPDTRTRLKGEAGKILLQRFDCELAVPKQVF